MPLGADPRTGQRRWTDRHFLFAHFDDAELGYAVTIHTAQGRTVHTGLAVITGTEDRQHAYVALTRGTHDNTAYVFTHSSKVADPAPGPRPAPELARYDRIAAPASEQAVEVIAEKEPTDVLAEVLDRDGGQLSASQAWWQALADADHLGVLHAIWTAETTPAREQRYREMLTAILPPGYPTEPGHRAQWLWRTLHTAELAGLDARQVLADAADERALTGARDLAAVIDARIRRRTGHLVPAQAASWSARLPDIADPDRRAYAEQIAALMDARSERIGAHAAATSLAWAVGALGEVPKDPTARSSWQQRAAAIGAYRELSSWDHPADPIGPEPVTNGLELQAAWHQALAALRPAAEPEITDQARTGNPERTPVVDVRELGQRIKDLAARHRDIAAKLAKHQSLMTPAKERDHTNVGPDFSAWAWTSPKRYAILQPPKSEIPPSAWMLERVTERDLNWEAGD